MDREYVFPLILYQSELEKWQEGLPKSEIRAMERAYHKYTVSSFKGAELESMLTKYPKMEDEPLYLVWENIQTFLKEQMEEVFAKQGFTYEDYLENKELYKESNIKEVPAFNLSVIYKLTDSGKNGKTLTAEETANLFARNGKIQSIEVEISSTLN